MRFELVISLNPELQQLLQQLLATVSQIATDPAAGQPVSRNKKHTASSPAQPVVAQPVVAQPVVAQPVVAQPVVAQPVVAQPVVAQPVVAQTLTLSDVQNAFMAMSKALASRGDQSIVSENVAKISAALNVVRFTAMKPPQFARAIELFAAATIGSDALDAAISSAAQ